MKRFSLLVGTLCMAASVGAQEITPVDTTFDDMRTVLESAGFEAYAFDLKDFLKGDGRYEVTFRVREYAGGSQTDSTDYVLGENKAFLTDYPEEQRSDIMADEAGVVSRAEKLVVGCYPSKVDSIATWMVELQDVAQMFPRLQLRNIAAEGAPRYHYISRPFETVEGVMQGEFIPLVFFGSMWYDEKYGVYRFCGEREIAPDLSSEIVGHVPHFYVMGVVFTPTEEE